MNSLQQNICGLPVELSKYIYRELIKIEIKRKKILNPNNHHLLRSPWYLNAIRVLIHLKVSKLSEFQHLPNKIRLTYFKIQINREIPDGKEMEQNYKNCLNLSWYVRDQPAGTTHMRDAFSKRMLGISINTVFVRI
ncbi:hypothetical protein ACJMK2_043123 [Sinanodonta woodiana]|uniref:Uncharacterized protein n=1 Tax=Sinanodonta woodiana TaxID=1069815 RepID=A0ABD3VZ39_SINWO